MIRRVLVVLGLLLMSVGVAGPVSAQADKDCGDYPTQKAAQDELRANPDDPYGLDGPIGRGTDGEPGVACESRPCPCDHENVYAVQTTTPTTAAPVVTTAVAAVTSPTTARPTVQRTTTANTGPGEVGLIAAAGALVLLAGTRMRGRRAAGDHFS